MATYFAGNNSSSGITFTNASQGTAGTLNWDEIYSAIFSFSGPWAAAQTCNIRVVRVGSLITFECLEGLNANAVNATTAISSAQTIPTRFLPSDVGTNSLTNSAIIINNATETFGQIIISTGGTVSFALAPQGAFTGAASCGFPRCSTSWTMPQS